MKIKDILTQALDWPESRYAHGAFGYDTKGDTIGLNRIAEGGAARVCLGGRCIEVADGALLAPCPCPECVKSEGAMLQFSSERFLSIENVLNGATAQLYAEGAVNHRAYPAVNDQEGHAKALLVLQRAADIADPEAEL